MNIPGYQLGREISVGEYCSVYNALELETSKTVTIMFFRAELSSNPEFCQHVKKISAKLLNKTIGNIIPIKQAAWKADGCYLITEYFPCTANREPLQTQFTIEEVLNFGLQLANSLSQLHAMGLVHGGVSTTNLLFPNLSHVTLGMMSFQRTFKKETLHSILPVPLEEAIYIAPEFSTGLDFRSDFYSLGVVLFELLFKTKPFNVENLQQLQIEKENMHFSIPNPSAKKLLPLFEALLSPNPEQRLASADEFIKLADQCGYQFESVNSSTDAAQQTTRSENKPPENQTKIILIYSAVAGFLMIAILSFFMFGDSTSTKQTAGNKKIETASIVEIVTTKAAEKVTTNNQTDNKAIANTLFEKAQQQIAQNNYGVALMSINNALKEDPEHQAAKDVKQKIELEFEIRSYLSTAEKLMGQRKLTRPQNDNAFSIYTKLATMLPPGDNRAKDGLQKIANRYYQLANNLASQDQFEQAKDYIVTGLSVVSDYPPLIQLDQFIQDKYNQQELQKKRKAEQLNQQKLQRLQQQRIAEREKQRQQKLLEQKRLAALEVERERNLQLQKKRVDIDRKFSEARNLLRKNQLSQQSINRSLQIHQELSSLAQQDSRLAGLFKDIVDSYGALASSQQDIPDLAEALKTINQGLALDRKNLRLLRKEEELKALIIAQEKPKKQVPIIGTF